MKNSRLVFRNIRLFYKKNRRDLPWRNDPTPYEVFVSEVMLQQTQVSRVLQKYPLFIKRFPNFKHLSNTTLEEILTEWQGMGYNRRALYLQQAAQKIMTRYRGVLPKTIEQLEELPGIGPATARSIYVFAWNKPTVFIETNIRRVFIHHFFSDAQTVSDKELVPYIESSLEHQNPREWYSALMDYGSHIAKKLPNPNRKSRHYSRQSKFEGSDREIRGKILKLLLQKKPLTDLKSIYNLTVSRERLSRITESMLKEGLIKQNHKNYVIA